MGSSLMLHKYIHTYNQLPSRSVKSESDFICPFINLPRAVRDIGTKSQRFVVLLRKFDSLGELK